MHWEGAVGRQLQILQKAAGDDHSRWILRVSVQIRQDKSYNIQSHVLSAESVLGIKKAAMFSTLSLREVIFTLLKKCMCLCDPPPRQTWTHTSHIFYGTQDGCRGPLHYTHVSSRFPCLRVLSSVLIVSNTGHLKFAQIASSHTIKILEHPFLISCRCSSKAGLVAHTDTYSQKGEPFLFIYFFPGKRTLKSDT